ncbi:MAG: hypothetical protein AAB289_06360 [Chloroflexota bacterium]
MAVAVFVEVPGVTAAQYDAMITDTWPGGHLPSGALFHLAGPWQGNWRVVDMWESAEAFDTFVKTILGPAMQKAGVTAQPKIEIWPVHKTAHTH